MTFQKDCFEEIHHLVRDKSYDEVIRLLINSKDNEINFPYKEDLNHSWYIIGCIFYERLDYDSAISAFQNSLEDWPEDAEAIIALANAYSQINDPKKAGNLLTDGLNKMPNDERLIYNLANALFDQAKYIESIKLYEKISSSNHLIYSRAQKNLSLAKIRQKKNQRSMGPE